MYSDDYVQSSFRNSHIEVILKDVNLHSKLQTSIFKLSALFKHNFLLYYQHDQVLPGLGIAC